MASLRMGFIASIWEILETGWQQLPDFPGAPRVQPVCVGQRKENETLLYLWGGFSGAFDGRSATLSTDGYYYSPSLQQWQPSLLR